jgi:uncharacterized delta-60 repeat protein
MVWAGNSDLSFQDNSNPKDFTSGDGKMRPIEMSKLHPEKWIAVFLMLALIFGLTGRVVASHGKEMLDERTLTTKTFDNGDGTFTFESHAGHIHYEDKATGALKECDTTLMDVGDRWVQTKASYACEIPKYANGDFVFADLFAYKNQTLVMRPLARHVPGEIDDSDGWVNKRVLYRNAYGEGLHLRVTAGNEGLFKEVIIENKPNPLRDLSFGFEINPPSEEYAYVFDGTHANGPKPVLLANLDITGDEQILMSQAGIAEDAFTRIKQIRIWDSEGEAMAGRIQFYREGEKLCFRKIVPKEFLATATYPVYTDDTVTYYAGAGDGYVQKKNSTNWNTTHDASNGQLADYLTNQSFFCRTGVRTTSNKYIITRGFFPFDTSPLPDSALISSASLDLYVSAVAVGDNDGEDFVVITQTSQPSTSSLSTADFNQCGSVNSPVEGSPRYDLSSGISVNTYNSFTLNETGRGWISTTGWTKLGMREGHDVLDHPYVGPQDSKNRIHGYWSEQTGTAQDPKLSITYQNGITVSGHGYRSEGDSYYYGIGMGRIISLSVDGGTVYSGTTDLYGNFSIDSITGVSAGSTITVWIDDDVNYRGTSVTIANDGASNISGFDIYGSAVIVRSEKVGTPITNADLAVFDKDDDADIGFTSNSGTLIVDDDHELHVWTGDTFSPEGPVTTLPEGHSGDIHIDDAAAFVAGGAVSCGGSWTADAGSLFTHNDNAVTFTATSGPHSITTNSQPFHDLAFDGIGGAWVFGDDPIIGGDLSIANGSVTGPSAKFGSYGIVTYSSGGTYGGKDYGEAIAVDAAGNCYVVGYQATNGQDIVILRYDPSGQLDPTWGDDGLVLYDTGSNKWDRAYDVAIDQAGGIYVAGSQGPNYEFLVLKYNADGSLDTTWGEGDGIATYALSETQSCYAYAMAFDGSGNVYVVGDTAMGQYDQDIVAVKFDSAGSVDTTWGVDGAVTYSSGGTFGGYDYGHGIAADTAGNCYVVGRSNNNDIVVLKYDPNGELDTMWGGGDGTAIYDSGSYDHGYDIALDSSGSCYVVGRQGFINEVLIMKFDATGSLDTTWGGGDGIATYSAGNYYNYGNAILLDSSGSIYVAGYSGENGTDILAMKLNADGSPDTTWGGGDGATTYNSGGGNYDYGNDIAIDAAGNAYVAGYLSIDSLNVDIVALKLTSGGDLYGNGDGVVNANGNWSNSGSFQHNGGEVIFGGTEAQQITSGGSDWNHIIVTNDSVEGITFADSFTCATFTDETPGSNLFFATNETYTITDTGGLNLNGASGDPITLARYGGSGTDQWNINPSGGSWAVSYVYVADSNNLDATPIIPSDSIDSGNNTN